MLRLVQIFLLFSTRLAQLATAHQPSQVPPHFPKMRSRAQHGISKSTKLFNLHSFSATSISPLPTNPLHALHDRNWKMTMKD